MPPPKKKIRAGPPKSKILQLPPSRHSEEIWHDKNRKQDELLGRGGYLSTLCKVDTLYVRMK